MSAPHARQEGFTLVEIIVAAVIGLVVASVIMTVLLDAMKGADRSIAAERATRDAGRLVRLLSNDVRAARAAGRDEVDDVVELAERIQAPGVPDVRDVVRAEPNLLQLRTRARATGVAHCITWARDAAGVVTRAVSTDWTCASAPTRTERLGIVPHTPDAHGRPGVASLFTYAVLVDDDLTSGDPASCSIVHSSAAVPIGRVVEIGARIDARTSSDSSAQRKTTTQLTAIRSRDEPDYRAALGCAW